jgi:limonene-1,2-epoxide hydrolase
MPAVIERMHEALNRHDIEAFLGCFDEGYRSEQPAHPNRGFGGKEQVRKNWSGMFESFPDFEARLLRHTTDEGVVWSEWHWRARGLNMAGVIIMGVEDERIVWARLYMEPVEEDGQDIDEAMSTITEGGRRAGDARSEEASPT